MISTGDWAELGLFLESLGDHSQLCKNSEFRADCERYLSLLLAKNDAVNLTGAKDLQTLFWKHLAESLALLSWEPLGEVVDWGSGGGLPGIPLALARRARGDTTKVHFLDSVGKKIRAVEEFAGELALEGSRFFNGRGEALISDGSFRGVQTVVMRAVAPAERARVWMSSAVPRWVFLISPAQVESWEKERAYLGMKKLRLTKKIFFDLPKEQGPRALLEYSKS
jgi:16S rRNA (guanine527-N7)-methyltransferase